MYTICRTVIKIQKEYFVYLFFDDSRLNISSNVLYFLALHLSITNKIICIKIFRLHYRTDYVSLSSFRVDCRFASMLPVLVRGPFFFASDSYNDPDSDPLK